MISGEKFKQLVDDGVIGISPFMPENIKGPALKLHLGDWYQMPQGKVIDVDALHSLPLPVRIEAAELHLLPNQMVLAQTLEHIRIPEGYVGWLESRGRAANVGLQSHLSDSHLDPGTDVRPWLQLKNQSDHTLVLRKGTDIAKLYIFEIVD